MDNQIRVLHVTAGMNGGGVGNLLLTYYKYIDKTSFHFDFVVPGDEVGMKEVELKEMGSEVFHITKQSEGLFRSINDFKKILQNNSYDAIHFHEGYRHYFLLKCAKKTQPKAIRFLHSHSAFEPESFIKKMIRKVLSLRVKYLANEWCACGKKAAEYLYGSKSLARVHIINNAIELDKFRFNQNQREEIRNQNNWSNKFVVGHIGRLAYQKNQEFLIDSFNSFHREINNSVLVIFGAGEDEEKIKEKVKSMGLNDDVILMGLTKDINQFYNAFDVFALPSRYEGLPIVGVEAQVNNCPCLFSTKITDEIKISDQTFYLEIDNEKIWVDKLRELYKLYGSNRKDDNHLNFYNRYNIELEAKNLELLYDVELSKRKEKK